MSCCPRPRALTPWLGSLSRSPHYDAKVSVDQLLAGCSCELGEGLLDHRGVDVGLRDGDGAATHGQSPCTASDRWHTD